MPNILIVDDDADFSALASAYFTKLGYKVTAAPNGRDGLGKARLVKPDIIFLDIMMPDMNGVEVLRELQSFDETADLPVLILTGKYIDRNMQDLFAMERNFKALLPKPVALDQLQRKVEALLKR